MSDHNERPRKHAWEEDAGGENASTGSGGLYLDTSFVSRDPSVQLDPYDPNLIKRETITLIDWWQDDDD